MADSQKEAKLIVSAEDKASRVLKSIGRELAGLGRRTGLTGVASQFGRVRASAGATVASIRRVGTALGALAGISLVGVAASVKGVVDRWDNLNDVRKSVHMLGQQVVDLHNVFGSMGVEAGAVDTGLTTMTKNVGDLQVGTGKLAAFLKKTHPELIPLIKNAKDGARVFEIFTTAMDNMTQAQRVAFASKVFGDPDFARISDMKPQERRDLIGQNRKLNGTVADQTLDGADSLNDSLGQMATSLGSLRDAVTAPLIEPMNQIAGSIRDWAVANREWIATGIGEKVKAVIDAIDPEKLKALAAAVNDVVEELGGWKTVIAVLAAAPFAGVALNVLNLAGAFLRLGAALAGNPVGLTLLAIAGAGALIYASWDDLAPHLKAAGDAFLEVGKNAGLFLDDLTQGNWSGALKAATDFGTSLQTAFGESAEAIGQLGITLNGEIAKLTGFDLYAWLPKSGEVTAKMAGIPTAIRSALSGIDLTAVGRSIIDSLLAGMTAAFDALVGTISSWGGQIKAALAGGTVSIPEMRRPATAGHLDSSIGRGPWSEPTNPVGGPRAGGGPVNAGTAYTIGERGRETFVPGVSGTILPHGLTEQLLSGMRAGDQQGPAHSSVDLLRRAMAAGGAGSPRAVNVTGGADLTIKVEGAVKSVGAKARGSLFKQINLDRGPAMRPASG